MITQVNRGDVNNSVVYKFTFAGADMPSISILSIDKNAILMFMKQHKFGNDAIDNIETLLLTEDIYNKHDYDFIELFRFASSDEGDTIYNIYTTQSIVNKVIETFPEDLMSIPNYSNIYGFDIFKAIHQLVSVLPYGNIVDDSSIYGDETSYIPDTTMISVLYNDSIKRGDKLQPITIEWYVKGFTMLM